MLKNYKRKVRKMEEKEYYSNGNIKEIRRYSDGKLHYNDAPAWIGYYKDGRIYREIWYKDDKCHKKDDPADIIYYRNGQICRKQWYKDGKPHREDGPADIWYDINGQIKEEYYYLNGEKVSRGSFIHIKKQINRIKKILEKQNQERRIRL
jgi:antitoxin component YwqK of YwqJK toxin-antitoxin module